MSPTNVSSHELAAKIEEWLSGSTPRNIAVSASNSEIEVVVDGGDPSRDDIASIADEDDGRSFEERVQTATLSLLSHVQDQIVLALGSPWPATSGSELPLPHVEVANGWLHAWFGDSSRPVLALGKVALDDLR